MLKFGARGHSYPRLGWFESLRAQADEGWDNSRPGSLERPRSRSHGLETTSADALAPALDQKKQHNGEADARNYTNHRNVVHVISPFRHSMSMPIYSKYLSNASSSLIIDGPNTTRNKDGKIKNTSGNTSFTVVFAACSSAD